MTTAHISHPLLAAANLDVLLWVAILLGATLSGSIVILQLRKRLFAESRREQDPGSLLEQLRAMERKGEISTEEFNRVRNKMVEKVSGGIGPGRSGAEATGVKAPMTDKQDPGAVQ
ncbi:MAG: hypothetical protein U0573_15580 [Phycisphaerales bacterium]|nr:hypothetical protein [Planctomycetota bacterium]